MLVGNEGEVERELLLFHHHHPPSTRTVLHPQELVWQVVNGLNLGKDRPNHHERSPFLEISALEPGPVYGREDELPRSLVEEAEGYSDPR